jgi:hypothetical protein
MALVAYWELALSCIHNVSNHEHASVLPAARLLLFFGFGSSLGISLELHVHVWVEVSVPIYPQHSTSVHLLFRSFLFPVLLMLYYLYRPRMSVLSIRTYSLLVI